MKRRTFLSTSLVSTGALLLPSVPVFAKEESQICVPTGLDFVSAEATYFARYEHYHLLSIPVSVLIEAPAKGYKTRTTTLDQDSLDNDAFVEFVAEYHKSYVQTHPNVSLEQLDASLRRHSHEVKFSQDDLKRIGSGEKDVEIVVKTPAGNLGHRFYFTAMKSTVIKVQKAKG